jgi:hypothetical protein|tara:strand:+ start:4710 stop:4973 length:264 start_codon:yes stop_codon:yes gene_type:complete
MSINKHKVMTRLHETSEFNDAVNLLITVEDNKLIVVPYGGTFDNTPTEQAREVYEIVTLLLQTFDDYGGVSFTDDMISQHMSSNIKH